MNYAVTELNDTTFNLYSALLAISGILLAVTAATGFGSRSVGARIVAGERHRHAAPECPARLSAGTVRLGHPAASTGVRTGPAAGAGGLIVAVIVAVAASAGAATIVCTAALSSDLSSARPTWPADAVMS